MLESIGSSLTMHNDVITTPPQGLGMTFCPVDAPKWVIRPILVHKPTESKIRITAKPRHDKKTLKIFRPNRPKT